jgi:hypothetical protein
MKGFNYENTETVAQKGGKIVRKVSIKRGRGYKSITKYRRGKKVSTIKKPIHRHHIGLIERGIFIPGLFSDCKGCKTKKRRGGGEDWDIEMGPKPEDKPVEPYGVPPDPKRFDILDQRVRDLAFSSSSSPEVAAAVYAGPNPEERQIMESLQMSKHDTKDVPNWEEMKIYSGGKTRRRRRQRRY